MTTRIKYIVLGTAVTLALLVSSSPTWAQSYYVTGYTPYVRSGYGFYGGGYHASTAAEGYLRGRAALVRAQGQASLIHSQALRQREAARQQYLANRVAKLRYYAEKQKLRAERKQRQREELVRRREIREQLAAKRRAESSIDWPVALKAKRYDSLRTEIESLVLLRTKLGSKTNDATSIAIRHGIRELAKQVVQDEKARQLDDKQSQVVRTFVRNLASEHNPARADTQLASSTAASASPQM